jgi:hypothetical protein
MRAILYILASSLLVCLPGSAKANGFFTGNDVLINCESKTPDLCITYVAGVHDALFVLKVAPYCTPDSITPNRLRRAVTKWLQTHPEQLHQPAASLVINALTDAYPCGQKK